MKRRYVGNFRSIRIERFFDRDGVPNRGTERLYMSEDLRRKMAEIFASYVYSTKKSREECVEALCSHNPKGLDFFQCFYFEYRPQHGEYPYWVSNGLSGPDYDYCKRGFLKANR